MRPILPLDERNSIRNAEGSMRVRQIPALNDKQRETFFSKMEQGEPGECWPWLNGRNSMGYGMAWAVNGCYLAHRVSFFIANPDASQSCVVAHRCDNTLCCNPNHLFDTTQAGNLQDMRDKGRGFQVLPVLGEAHGMHKLTADQVLAIRASNLPHALLAEHYGISRRQINSISNRKCWTHL